MQHAHDERPTAAPAQASLPGRNGQGENLGLLTALLATAGLFLARLPLLPLRRFDPDELEHAHAAWCVWKGMVPYRDFFEHHTPWYHYLLSPVFRWFPVDLSFASARHFLFFGRGLSLALTLLSLLLVVHLGRMWQDRRIGIVAGFFFVGLPVVMQKTVEIRPDVLALPWLLGGLAFLLRALTARHRQLRACFAGGLCVGAAIMCTQKMLFVLPGAFLGLGLWALLGGERSRIGSRILAVTVVLVGLAVAPVLTWAGFAAHQAGDAFITNNFLLNAKWRQVVHQQLMVTLETSWPVLVLALLGATASLYAVVRARRPDWGGVLLLSTLLGLIAGILVVPVAHRQYYLMALPLAALFGAKGLVFLVERAQPRARPWLLTLAVLPLGIWPVFSLRQAYGQPNTEQLARLRYVFDHTAPTDVVMDGWKGMGVFRPHAFYYYFLHEELVPMLPQHHVDAFLDQLEHGKVHPRMIVLDRNLLALGSRFVRFLNQNYATTDGEFYLAKQHAQ